MIDQRLDVLLDVADLAINVLGNVDPCPATYGTSLNLASNVARLAGLELHIRPRHPAISGRRWHRLSNRSYLGQPA